MPVCTRKWFVKSPVPCFSRCTRLRSRDRRTLERSNVSFSGPMPKEPCMGCSRQTLKWTRVGSLNSTKSLRKPKGEQKLPGDKIFPLLIVGASRTCELCLVLVCPVFFLHYFCVIFSRGLGWCEFRLRELHTLKGHVESVVRLKGLDIETIQQSYTV